MSALKRRVGFALLVAVLGFASACSSSPSNSSPSNRDAGASEVAFSGCDVEYPDPADSPYILPYAVGEAYAMGLNNCSSSFHARTSPDSFAYDFDMPVGTPILASRGGTVVVVDEDKPDFGGGLGNIVSIDHGDGTTAVYLHFTTDEVEVEVGDVVAQGDVLGLSGASGKAGYPHLHLIVVESPADFPYTGVAISFSNTDPFAVTLITGETYAATAWDQP